MTQHPKDFKPRYRSGDGYLNEIEKEYAGGVSKPSPVKTDTKTGNKKNTQNHKVVVYSVRFRDDENPSGHAVAWFYGKRFPLWKRVLLKLIGGEIVEGKCFSSTPKKQYVKPRKQCAVRWEENEL